ncbi:MAG: PilZ domain-containing protein [Proteobacteria bacterium]|nr:PilZ domain-containing protein [Pseudomonadota bacterium]
MNEKDKLVNNRTKLRVPILVTHVTARAEGKVFFGYAKNISGTGMFIQSINPKKPGEQFEVEFSLFGDDEVLSSHVAVVWNQGYTKDMIKTTPGMGLKFLGIRPDFSEKISLWVESQLEDEASPDYII